MRIGNIKNEKPVKIHDAYENDPERSPILVANSEKPFNGEPPFELLPESFITPNSLFFVRNHLPVPQVNPKDVGRYELEACVDKSKHSKREFVWQKQVVRCGVILFPLGSCIQA